MKEHTATLNWYGAAPEDGGSPHVEISLTTGPTSVSVDMKLQAAVALAHAILSCQDEAVSHLLEAKRR